MSAKKLTLREAKDLLQRSSVTFIDDNDDYYEVEFRTLSGRFPDEEVILDATWVDEMGIEQSVMFKEKQNKKISVLGPNAITLKDSTGEEWDFHLYVPMQIAP